MKFLNLNSLQTYLSAILAALPVLLVNLGCTLDAVTQKLDCSQAIIAPTTLGWIAAGIGFIKLVIIPAIQPGGWLNNLFATKAPVVATTPSEAQPKGTVAPSDVQK